MPFTQQDAEGIGANIGSLIFRKRNERWADEKANKEIERKKLLEEFVANLAYKQAMDQTREREQGETAREKMRLDRQDAWNMRNAGVSSDNMRQQVEQRDAEAEMERQWRAQAAREELARRRAADAMDWTNKAAEQAQKRIEFKAEQDYKNKLLPYQKAEAISRLGQAIYATDQANYELDPEVAAEMGWRPRNTALGSPGAGVKAPTRPVFNSVTKPAVRVDHSVTNDATNVPMPPDANGQRKSSRAGGEHASNNLPGGLEFRKFIEALSDKSLKPR